MPSTVSELIRGAGLEPAGGVTWGVPVPARCPGVYLVSLYPEPEATGGLPKAPIAVEPIRQWLEDRPELLLDGQRPTAEQLAKRVSAFWLPDEPVLYVGKASELRRRVGGYYRTPLGARRPHAGGYLLKTLANLGNLHVHYAATSSVGEAERAEADMLGAFIDGVPGETRALLHDPHRPFPFANLEYPAGNRKEHGITGAREPR